MPKCLQLGKPLGLPTSHPQSLSMNLTRGYAGERAKACAPKDGLGGTANLAVLGGNLPPSLALEAFCDPVTSNALDCRAGRPTERASGPFHPDQRHLLVRFRDSRRDFFRRILSPLRGEGSQLHRRFWIVVVIARCSPGDR